MRPVLSHTNTLKELFFFWERSEKDPSTFYRFFGTRKNSEFSILSPVILLSSFRKNMRFLQGIIRSQSLPLVIFFNIKNKFLRRQLYFLSLRLNSILLVDINDVDIHLIYKKKLGSFCVAALFLTPEQEYQLAVQSHSKLIPTVFFKSPSSNDYRGDGSVVTSFDSCPTQVLIVHFLCLGLFQASKLNKKKNEKKF